MKLCGSPKNRTCTYQRLARDQAPDAPDNGAQSDPAAVQRAYGDLAQHLGDDAEGLAMLKHLMSTLTGDLGQDEPPPVLPGPSNAMDAQLRSGRRQAQQFLFAKRFPGAGRIRVIG
jgi:hypothetical protein